MSLDYVLLLCITGVDTIGPLEIYERYMHFGQISYIGKKSVH